MGERAEMENKVGFILFIIYIHFSKTNIFSGFSSAAGEDAKMNLRQHYTSSINIEKTLKSCRLISLQRKGAKKHVTWEPPQLKT